jgi:hypothetical protein
MYNLTIGEIMSREKQRQANRLRRLAEIISTFKDYDQECPSRCVVGMGVRLERGKLAVSRDYSLDKYDTFSKRYGVSTDVVENIWNGSWHYIKGIRSKDADCYAGKYEQKRGAVRLLNNIAKRIEAGLPVG